ncbi:MAG: hypothetical protein IID45_10675, partial [Planctomycetes bacterium]|nr:hypothetical protein [Planctomycetota bacterium]
MNCDQAFEWITEPSRRNQPALQQHLRHCRRCRQMQEVLAPALELLTPAADEIIPGFEPAAMHSGFESQPPPHAIPFLSPASVRVAEQSARTLARTEVKAIEFKPSQRTRFSRLAGIAAALLIGAGLAFAAFGPVFRRSADKPVATMDAPKKCRWTQRDDVK